MAKKATSETNERPDAACRIVLLTGPDQYLQAEHVAVLKALLQKEYGEVDVLHFEGKSAQAAEVLDECRSFGLIAAHKMIVVDDADQLVKEASRPLFERYATAPSEGATLVLRATKWSPGKLDAMIDEVGRRVRCEPLSPEMAVKWSVLRCRKRHRAELEADAAETLVERVGTEMGRLDSELAKLAAAADVGTGSSEVLPRITVALVGQFVGIRREEEVWGVQETLLFADAAAAVTHVRRLLDVSRQPSQLILWAMSDLSRKVLGASHAARKRINPFHVAKVLKLWGPSKDAVLHAASTTDPAAARRVLDACVKADARSKSGLTDADAAVERLAIDFAAMRRR
jgi:DNA polymerase III subunit delta